MPEMNDNTKKCVFDKGAVCVLPEVDISGIRRKFLDLPYAEDSAYQKLDLYLPDEGDGPFPLVMFIHGGGWRRGDKRDTQMQGFLKLLKQGYAVASINWRLSFEAVFPACLYDCKAAVRYLRANAEKLHIDPTRIAAAGGSAGAHLALLLATTGGNSEMEDLSMGNREQDSSVQCVISWFAATDLVNLYDQVLANEKEGIINISDNSFALDDPEAPSSLILGGPLNELKLGQIRDASPIYSIHDQMPPILLQHGKVDFIVPRQQSVTFYEKAVAAVGKDKVELTIIDTALHMDPQFETDENMARVDAFLSKHLR